MEDMIGQWIKEIKARSDFRDLGMILVHNGMVRATYWTIDTNPS